MKKRVTVIAHEAFLGASRVTIDVCKELKSRGWAFSFVIHLAGVLLSEFEEIGPTVVLDQSPLEHLKDIQKTKLLTCIHEFRPTIIYASTCATCPSLAILKSTGIPVVMHVHELATGTFLFARPFGEVFYEVPSVYLGASRAVVDHLVRDWSVDRKKVHLAYEGADLDRIDKLLKSECINIKKTPGFVVAAAGECRQMKGTDIWLEAAAIVSSTGYPINYIWFGGPIPTINAVNKYCMLLNSKIDQLNLRGIVHFPGWLKNYYPLLAQCDVFTLPSREDPCPLVVLDSLYLSIPVICARGCGGAPEVVGEDAGIVVSELSPDLLAYSIITLYREHELRKRMGQAGRKKIIRDFGILRLANQIEYVFGGIVADS